MTKIVWPRGWIPLLLLPSFVLFFMPSKWPAWALMWALATAIYAGCKWLTWRRRVFTEAPAWKHVAYLLAWPGLDAATFIGPAAESAPRACRVVEWLRATGRLAFGLTLLYGVARIIPSQWTYIIGWSGMVGIVLILHFGIFHLLSCVWRTVGVQARPLMNRPLAATSLAEFWGRRWNTAFRDFTHRFLFRPLTVWFGSRLGLFAGFVFSGAVHDLVISVPSQGGYGGPTMFFTIQGAAMMIERSAIGRRIGLGSGATGRLFALLMLIGPVWLLFHRAFVTRVIVPFMQAVGAV